MPSYPLDNPDPSIYDVPTPEEIPSPYCMDCSLPYSDPGFCDLVVSHEVWKQIAPDDGLLCPTCLVRRAEKAGIENATATFRSGPFANERRT